MNKNKQKHKENINLNFLQIAEENFKDVEKEVATFKNKRNIRIILSEGFPIPPFQYCSPVHIDLCNLTEIAWTEGLSFWTKGGKQHTWTKVTAEAKQLGAAFTEAIKGMTSLSHIDEIERKLSGIPDPQTRYNFLFNRIQKNEKAKGFKPVDEMTRWLKDKLKDEEEILVAIESKEKKNQKILPPEIKPLEDKSLKNVFKALKINVFKIIEERLYNRGYINTNRHWLKSKLELVALISVLLDNNFFRNNQKEVDVKNFFQSLYQIKIGQQFEPAKRNKADKFKPIFESMLNDKQ